MKQKTPFKTEFCSDRDRIRTYDRLLRRQMLYPAELRDRVNHNRVSQGFLNPYNLFRVVICINNCIKLKCTKLFDPFFLLRQI